MTRFTPTHCIATYNSGPTQMHRKVDDLNLLRKQGAQIISCQEMNGRAKKKAVSTFLRQHSSWRKLQVRRPGGINVLILFDSRIFHGRVASRWMFIGRMEPGAGPNIVGPKVVTRGIFRSKASGMRFEVRNTHLLASWTRPYARKRKVQAEKQLRMAGVVKDLPQLLTGDLNGRYPEFQQWLDKSWKHRSVGPTHHSNREIDFIFARGGIEFVGKPWKVNTSSDHHAVLQKFVVTRRVPYRR